MTLRGCVVKVNQHALPRSVWGTLFATNEKDVVEANIPMQDAHLTAGFVSYCRV
jgi:hypothetical protein